jgi:hypothetical protein
MRNAVRSLVVAAAVAAVAIACGSGPESEFVEPSAQDGEDAFSPPPGTFQPVDAGTSDGQTGCKPLSCTTANANCGPIGDGCGGTIPSCGTCGIGDTCGGGGKPSQCGRPACKKKTCADLDANCGSAGDGCGGLITSCGTCDAGICGGGGPSKCGAGGAGDGGACVPTKVACAANDCGPIANGCGGLLACPAACPAGQTCGGGATPSVCGAPPCVKKTCGTQNCGFIADGCGGSVNCWPGAAVCPPGMSCGGAGAPNTCGTPPGCTGLCTQQQACVGGGTTSIEGYVTSPNGVLPVPNAVVYVPNAAVAPFTTGVKCENCAAASGSPLISTTTDANGHFLLPNMPVSTPGKVIDIPVVVQLGRWRKQLTIATTACTNNLVPAVGPGVAANKTAALPSRASEGDIPLTAISTGFIDGLECVFRKMGVADTEFTNAAGAGRIRLYQDNGAMISAASTKAATLYATQTEIDKYDAVIFGCVGSAVSKTAAELTAVLNYANKGGRVFATHWSEVWLNSATTWGATASKWAPGTETWDNTSAPGSLSAIVDTSFPKGVLFSTWLQAPVAPVSATYAPPYAPVAALYATSPPTLALTEPRKDINPYYCVGGAQAGNPCTRNSHCNGGGGGTCTGLRPNSGIVAPAQRWIYATDDNGKACANGAACKSGVCTAGACVGSVTFDAANDPVPQDAPMHYTFNTPPLPAPQCGRVLYSDFHVSIGNSGGVVFPGECNNSALTSQEKVLAYMLFDLASCVSPSAPPVCAPKTCAAQGLGCGLAGNGCGEQIDCGPCPPGEACGGGGVPSQCGAPACAPRVCMAGECGKMGNGCGGTLDCGLCGAGTCGGGGPNVCGVAACVPTACPAPAPASTCGPVANGCGAVNNCPCPAGMPCVNGQCGAPPCVPRNCAEAGANCGTVANGCGGTLACGNCIAPQTCGGGGTANLCGGGVN